jgi:cation diffusion facilitator family transporter
MNKIIKVLLISTISNIFLVIMKLAIGILGNCKTLVADAIKSLTDLITDVVAIVGEEIFIRENKKANKNIEYITSIIMGALIIMVGFGLLAGITSGETLKPNIMVLYAIIISIVIKQIIANYIIYKGKLYNNHILIASGKESKTEVISSLIVLITFFLSQLVEVNNIFRYSDIVGSFIIGIIIIKTGYDILKDNIISVFGEKHNDQDFIDEIKNIVENHPNIKKINNIGIIKYGSHYKTLIEIVLVTELGIIETSNVIVNIKKKLTNKFKHKMKHLKIKVKD